MGVGRPDHANVISTGGTEGRLRYSRIICRRVVMMGSFIELSVQSYASPSMLLSPS